MTTIDLTGDEQRSAIRHGKEIYQNKLDKGTVKAPVDKKRQSYHLDVISVASEMAVYKFLGIEYVEELFDVRDEQDIIIKGITADIKVGQPNNNLLKVQKWHLENKKFGLYIAVNQTVEGSIKGFGIAGFISQEKFRARSELRTFRGYEDKPMYCLHYSKLQDIAILAFLQELP
jgi:hypothetical protein